RGSERGDGLVEAGLVHGHHVEVSLHQHRAAGAPEAVARLVEAKEQLALFVERALRRVEVLGRWVAAVGRLFVGEATTGKADHLARREPHRTDEAIAKAIVVAAALARSDQAELVAELEGHAGALEVIDERTPLRRREPEAEIFGDRFADPATRQIRAR